MIIDLEEKEASELGNLLVGLDFCKQNTFQVQVEGSAVSSGED